MTNRIFEDAMSTARGRGSPYGIRMVSRATPRAPSNINTIETDSPAYSMSRRRASPVDSSPDSITGSLVERVRRAGIITDIDDRHLTPAAQQIIDDLLFKLKQTNDEKQRLTMKVYDLYKQQKTRKHEDDDDEREARPPKRRESRNVTATTSPTSTPSSVGLALDFDWLRTTGREVAPLPGTRDTDMPQDPPFARGESVQVTPPGPLAPDPVVRSDPRGMDAVVAQRPLPDAPDETGYDFDESDPSDSGEEGTKKKKKHINKEKERERDRELIGLDRLDLPIPPFWDVIRRTGYFERDNHMRNMLSGSFYVSTRDNVAYHRLHQGAQIALDERGAPHSETIHYAPKFDKASPKGMPLTAWHVNCLIKMLRNEYSFHNDRTLAYVFLRELYFIAMGVHPDQRDHAMSYILMPGIFDPNYMPSEVSPATLLPRMPDPGKPPGITNVSPENALNIDEMARYAILYGRPGQNFFTGVVMDYAYRFNRRSIFGYGLVRILSPEGKNQHFRRYVAALLALPRRYREEIEAYNARNPSTPFVPQPGPTYAITRLQAGLAQSPNMNLQTIINLFIENRIPPEWVDHGYTFGLNFINHQYQNSQLVLFLDEIDHERLERLRAYGVPPAIPAWDGWRHPTDEDIHRIRQLVAHRAATASPMYDHRTERGWTRVGEDGLFTYLPNRPEAVALRYRALHSIQLPTFPTLDAGAPSSSTADTNMSAVDSADTNVSADDPMHMEVEAAANANAPPPSYRADEHVEGGTATGTGQGAPATREPPQ